MSPSKPLHEPSNADRRFRRRDRLRRSVEFRHVYDQRRSVSDAQILLHGCPNGLKHTRLGLSVSRRVGQATVRNLWKRRLREAFRTRRADLPRGLDLVVIPRQNRPPELASLQTSLMRLAAQLARKWKLPDLKLPLEPPSEKDR